MPIEPYDDDDDLDDDELTLAGVMSLIAADVVTQELERLAPSFAGFHVLFRANSTPETRLLLEGFDAACDRFRAQFHALESARHILYTVEGESHA